MWEGRGLPLWESPFCRPGGRPPKSPFPQKIFSRKPAVFPFSTLQGVALSYRLKSRQEGNLRGRRGSFRKGHRGSGAGCPAGGEKGRCGQRKGKEEQEAQSGRGKGKRPKGGETDRERAQRRAVKRAQKRMVNRATATPLRGQWRKNGG